MTCIQARAQLATYRRDDWTANEMRVLSEHLANCAACRQIEAAYRQVGESLRLLPTITPDATFRNRVFAAITAEQRRASPAALQASRATTDPSLPVVRAPVDAPFARRRPGPLAMAALVAAAVLLLSLVTMQWLSARANTLAANLSRETNVASVQSHLASYLPDQRFYQVSSLSATRDWLAYVASDGAGSTMLFVVDRSHGMSHPVFTSPTTGRVALVSLTSHWVVWSVSSSAGWTVSAAPLTGSAAWKSQILSQSVVSTLTGAWANDSKALIATSANGAASLTQLDMASSGSANAIAAGSHQGATITNPSMSNGVIYWADVWADLQGSLHSAVWEKTPSGVNPVTQAGGEAYAPLALNGSLIWLSATHALNVSAPASASIIVSTAAQASGKLVALNISKGSMRTLANETAAATVRASGATVLWSDSATIQSYDLNTLHATAANALMAHAQVAGAGNGALAWFDGAHIVVYALS
jgi:hypothetical protein